MKRLLFLLVCLLVVVSVASADHDEPTLARLRVANYGIDAPNFDVLVNDEVVFEDVAYLTTSAYIEIEAGEVAMSIVPTEGDLDGLLLEPLELDLDWSHDYVVTVIGQVADESLSPLVIDETETVLAVKEDGVEASYAVLLHGISDGPAVDFYMDGERLIEGLEFGEYAPVSVSVEPHDIVVSFADDPDTVIFENSGETPPSGDFLLLTVMLGSYPDALDVSGAVTKLPEAADE